MDIHQYNEMLSWFNLQSKKVIVMVTGDGTDNVDYDIRYLKCAILPHIRLIQIMSSSFCFLAESNDKGC